MTKKILIIEDDLVFCKLLGRFLEKIEYQTTDTQLGNKGIELATQNSFDFAVVDYRLPDINGTEVIQKINKISPNTVCILMSRYSDQEMSEEARKNGAKGFLTKPFKPSELLKFLNE
ncbi:MAG: response regulator [Cyclobacteriaceae bacterium]|nr:response regulator [Cyclobacteriaceae bacterium]